MKFDEITFFVNEDDDVPSVDVQWLTYYAVVHIGGIKMFFESKQALINFKNNVAWAVENAINPR